MVTGGNVFDPERLLGQMLGGALGDAFGGKRGKRRRSAFSTGSVGGKATLGLGLLGVAMAAWEHYGKDGARNGAGAAPPGAGSTPSAPPHAPSAVPPPPPPGAPTRPMPLLDARQQSVVLLIRTMISAANADGHIDAQERENILGRARDGGLDQATIAFLDAEIAKPQTLAQVIANAKPEFAAETYAAAALAITVDTDAERAWLDQLAQGLRLDASQRADIDARLATA
jgi:uncharacterized membrane protein YebE (DUF533 family)